MIEYLLLSSGILFFILLSAFFAGSETGFMSVNKIKMNHQAEQGDELAVQTIRLLKKPARLLGTTLVGTNISVVSATVLTNELLKKFMDVHYAQICSTIGLTVLMLVFSEIIPKAVFQKRADELTRRSTPFLRFSMLLFYPISLVVSGFSNLVLLVMGKRHVHEKHALSREDIELLAGIGAEEGIINKTAQAFIHSVFSFGRTTAREIMTPLVDVVSIEQKRSINMLVKLADNSGFSRIPVFRKHIYDMLGYVSTLDLIHSRKRDTLNKYIRPAVFIPETKRIDRLLLEMRQEKLPLVFVVDEWGGTAGIITHEDIAEYVVGQIRDRGEKIKIDIHKVASGEYLIDGGADVDLVQEELNIDIEKSGFETVAGFVACLMQRIPEKGDVAECGGYKIHIEEAEKTVVTKVRFIRKRPSRSGKRHSH